MSNSARWRPAAAWLILLACRCGTDVRAAGLDEIVNYLSYSEHLASSGQPTKGQLKLLAEAGFERIVFLAFSDSEGALANEDRLVRDLGMEYVHIPVIWEQPAKHDFNAFAAVMRQAPAQKTLVHCQVNYRASAFSFLYRVLFEAVPLAEAKNDMNGVWVPNNTWRTLIFSILEDHGVSPHCATCLWASE